MRGADLGSLARLSKCLGDRVVQKRKRRRGSELTLRPRELQGLVAHVHGRLATIMLEFGSGCIPGIISGGAR